MYIRSNVFPLCVYVCASLCTSAWGLRLGVHQRGCVCVYMGEDLRPCVHERGPASVCTQEWACMCVRELGPASVRT